MVLVSEDNLERDRTVSEEHFRNGGSGRPAKHASLPMELEAKDPGNNERQNV